MWMPLPAWMLFHPAAAQLARLPQRLLDGGSHRVDSPAGQLDYGVRPPQDSEERCQKLVPPLGPHLDHHTHGRKVIGEASLGSGIGGLFPQLPDAVRVGHLVEDVLLALHVGAHHLQVVLRRFMEALHNECLAIKRRDVVNHLRRNALPLGPPLRVPLAKGQVVHDVGDVRDRGVDVDISECLCLQMEVARNARNSQNALHLAALVEDRVMLRNDEVAIPDRGRQKADDVVDGPLLLEHFEGAIALVEPHGRECSNLGLLAVLAKIHTVDLQELHGCLIAVAIGETHLFAQPVRSLYPRWRELAAVDTPLSEKVHQGEIVEGHSCLEVIVVEVVISGRPISIEILLLLLGNVRVSVHLLEDRDLLLRVGVAPGLTGVVHGDVVERIRTVHPLFAKLVPNTELQVLAREVVKHDVKVDLHQRLVVFVHDDVCLV
mmetsp:Transcript_73219/g.218458  ORF Transcript_73219/g.218458 Transcript_73219/m.218458 type:complete len:433 (-) Transcript_73219:274-1572(-)